MKNGADRNGKFIAVANMKGGVGKTTTVVSLAEFLSLGSGKSVLVVDLDQQASASLCIIGDRSLTNLISAGRTIEAFLALKLIKQVDSDLRKRIRRRNCTVTFGGEPVYIDVLPAGPDLRLVEREMMHSLSKKKFDMDAINERLFEFFEVEFAPLRDEFDYVVFDCAPGISPFTEIAIRSSDLILVPTIPDRISAFGLKGFCELIAAYGNGKDQKTSTHVLLNRVQTNVKQHKEVQTQLRSSTHFAVLKTVIPQSASLAHGLFVDDPPSGLPPYIPTMNGKYGAVMVGKLQNLADEVRGLLHENI